MKLILAVDALSPALSGIGRYVWELTQRLEHVPGVEQVRYYRNGRWVSHPVALLTEPKPRVKWRLNYPRWTRQWLLKRACRASVFHGPNFFLPPCAEHGVITVHDLSVLKFPHAHPAARLRDYEKYFNKSLDKAVQLITVSETTRQEIITDLGWPPERIQTIYNGVSGVFRPRDEAELAPVLARYGLRPGAYALCVATIEPRKGIGKLLAAYARLPTGLRNTCPLVLVGGKGWQSEALHAEIDTASAAGWLHYPGFVAEADLPAFYAGARLFVYPSYYEGFGLPVAEAMASGVPVLTSNRSCLPEIAGGAACLVDPDDADEMLAALRMGLEDEQWRTQARESGLGVAKRYNWNRCALQTVDVYKAALGPNET